MRLNRTFDVVLLASHLVNVPDDVQRDRLLATCRDHVAATGVVHIQRFTPDWARQAAGVTDLGNGITNELTIEPRHLADRRLVSAVSRYVRGSDCWEQTYLTRPLDDDELSIDLARARLRLGRWLSDDGRWVIAKPVF